ncbi:MAG: FtsX-like permease family protein, partial [Candidatus Altiarchaeales archaeon]|nr:FtsX-like permease family protein [Candidatus Altiarchaeales archaeon]
GMTFLSAKAQYGGEAKYTFILGLPTDEQTQDILLSGTGITISGKQSRFKTNDRYKAAVGYRWWIGDFFDEPVRSGDTIKIDGKDFEVVGEVSQVGNDQDDSQVYIPYDTALDLAGKKEKDYMVIMARVKPGFLLNQTSERIEEDLRKSRGLDEGDEDFSVTTLEDIQESVDGVLSAVKWFLVGIAAISLFVGGVGIMNTMYTSVLERTKEIGLMKAVGAKNSDIRTLFLIESGIIGMLGGVIGCIIGSSLSLTIQYFASQDPATASLKASISPELVGGALLFSFLVGVVSGVLPAIQASKLQPVDALRYE